VEEAPAPLGGDARRQRMAESAIAIAREAGYRNAGTVEFVVDDRSFFFLEVNARLQVEHPVTELVFGLDLVEQQLRIALGERLDLQLKRHGRQHAVEARVYAEDPAAGFLPSTGQLAHLRWPERAGIRVDAGYEEGDVVTRHYDPLLAKVIAFGGDRRIALGMLANALDETEVLGVRTNIGFLRALVRKFNEQGTMSFHTELVERILPELVPQSVAAPDEVYAVAAAAVAAGARDHSDPWTGTGPWRIGEAPATTIALREGARERAVRLSGNGPYTYAGHRVVAADEPHRWLVDDSPAAAAASDGAVWATVGGGVWELETTPREREVERAAGAEVAAPMPGLVIAAQAVADRPVRRGDLLFVVEAMKMELRVEAPADGKVTRVLASVGQQVERGQRLAEFEANAV
jgi:acetyl/propionyl-CoA carboxylase alpha subunit